MIIRMWYFVVKWWDNIFCIVNINVVVIIRIMLRCVLFCVIV